MSKNRISKFVREPKIMENIRDIEIKILTNSCRYEDIVKLRFYASKGYSLALVDYATCLMSGIYVEKDDEEAIKCLSLAKKNASSYELYLIGVTYLNFSDIPRYLKEAENCLQKSVEMGFQESLDVLLYIADLYSN